MSAQRYRVHGGGRIQRAHPLRFQFDGRSYQGFRGDTLASALLANGVRVVGRSFKYHRPRGLMAAGAEEPNALVTVGTGATAIPNLKATEVVLQDGLVARAVNCWPSAERDVGGIIYALSRFMPAGFYYKTFKQPGWHLYEGLIRNAAGLGKTPDAPDPASYEHVHAHADLLVVGAGPAGLAAALAAGRSGARVLLCHAGSHSGGGLNAGPAEVDGAPALDWAAAAWAELSRMPEVMLLAETTAFGCYDHQLFALLQRLDGGTGGPREAMWQVRARRVILATGGHERPLVFPGNDRPGVMLAGAVRRYLHEYGVLAGRQAVIVTNNDTAYRTAFDLAEHVPVNAIIDTRANVPEEMLALSTARGIEVLAGCAVGATHGRGPITGISILGADGSVRRMACDLLAVSGGWNPAVHLYAQAGGLPRYDEQMAMLRPDAALDGIACAGLANGASTLPLALQEGHAAGVAAMRALGYQTDTRAPSTPPTRTPTITACWRPHPAATGKAWVDFQNDVTVDDVALAARENFVSVEHLKRYTTLGMAVDQGKTSNVNGLAILAELTGRTIAHTGTTRFRPPYTPVTVGAFAGRQTGAMMHPPRRAVLDSRHRTLGAEMRDYGGWWRPAFYPRQGETEAQTIRREALCVRQAAGLFDASPLGKIEVKGPDAGRFLDRFYVNSMSRLGVGRVRYGLMLNEFGVIIDDGVTARLADNHFLVGTTSGGADRILAAMEEWHQCEWPDMELVILPVTAAWSTLTLTGPNASRILSAVGTDLPPFPHMSWRQGLVGGVPARVARVSYTGEVSYEISVAPTAAPALWDAMREAGAVPFGIEAMMVLRTEKGFLHVGSDTDGTTLPGDVGWGAPAEKAGDFIGRRSLTLPAARRPDRLCLVGVEPVEPKQRLPVGAHLQGLAGEGGSQGYITSACDSPTLGRSIGLAMLSNGRERLGEVVQVAADTPFAARIVSTAFYDPEGERLNG